MPCYEDARQVSRVICLEPLYLQRSSGLQKAPPWGDLGELCTMPWVKGE